MDNLEQALELRDEVLKELEHSVMLRSRGYQTELVIRLMAVVALAVVDMAGSLREMLAHVEESSGNQDQ